MSEYIVNFDGEVTALGTALAVACAGAGFAREEIVRCRDCKHYTEDEAEYWHYCGEWCEQVEPDGFCAWAKRKGDAE